MTACQTPRDIKIRDEQYRVPCGSRYCSACGRRWEQDQRVRAVAASEHLPGSVGLVTVTAPGDDWWTAEGARTGNTRREEMRAWNASARARWRRAHEQASRVARTYARAHGERWRLLYRSWEYQKRGLLHVHAVVPAHTPVHETASTLYVASLWARARRHGFGYVMAGDSSERPGWQRPPRLALASETAAARYVAKYVSSVGAGKEGMVSAARKTAQRGSILYVSRWLTAASGVTMTSLRARRRVHARYGWASSSRAAWRAACVVDAVQRGRPPLTTEAEAAIRAASQDGGATLWVDTSTGELRPPTHAPVPLATIAEGTGRCRDGAVACLGLASVLLRDPDAPWLGSERTVVTAVTYIRIED